ncbi:MAG: hypothetical protein AAGB15_05620 [Pseudomonadota bacterium]
MSVKSVSLIGVSPVLLFTVMGMVFGAAGINAWGSYDRPNSLPLHHFSRESYAGAAALAFFFAGRFSA